MISSSGLGPASRKIIKKTWTSEEDEKLLVLVEQHGKREWSRHGEEMKGRTGKQCRERYMNHLCDGIRKGSWTKEEDELIVKQQLLLGNQWAVITKMLPGRSDNAVKNRWHAAQRHMSSGRANYVRREWKQHEDDYIVSELSKGTNFSKIAKNLPGRTTELVNKRWNVIQRRINKTIPTQDFPGLKAMPLQVDIANSVSNRSDSTTSSVSHSNLSESSESASDVTVDSVAAFNKRLRIELLFETMQKEIDNHDDDSGSMAGYQSPVSSTQGSPRPSLPDSLHSQHSETISSTSYTCNAGNAYDYNESCLDSSTGPLLKRQRSSLEAEGDVALPANTARGANGGIRDRSNSSAAAAEGLRTLLSLAESGLSGLARTSQLSTTSSSSSRPIIKQEPAEFGMVHSDIACNGNGSSPKMSAVQSIVSP